MSDKDNKKIRRAARKHIKVELKDVAISFQSLILKFGFRQRFKIAIQILRGKPFLGGVFDADTEDSDKPLIPQPAGGRGNKLILNS